MKERYVNHKPTHETIDPKLKKAISADVIKRTVTKGLKKSRKKSVDL